MMKRFFIALLLSLVFSFPSCMDASGNVVVNGTFSSDTVWYKGSTWTIAGGVATGDGADPIGLTIWQINILSPGQKYLVIYTVVSIDPGMAITPRLGGTNGTTRTSIGTYTEFIISGTGDLHVTFFKGGVDAVTIDNVIVTVVPSGPLALDLDLAM